MGFQDKPVTVRESGIDLDGDILYKFNPGTSDPATPVWVNLRKEWRDGYIAGQEILFEIMSLYLNATPQTKDQVYNLLLSGQEKKEE